MKRTMIAPLIATLLGLTACGPLASDPAEVTDTRPSLAMAENSREAISGIASNTACPGGEDIEISGFIHKVISVTTDANGALHFNGHLDWTSLKGTGLVTGAQYVGFQQDKFTLTAPAGVRSATEVFHGLLVGLGKAPDLRFRVLWHITVTPDGKVASFIDSFTIEC